MNVLLLSNENISEIYTLWKLDGEQARSEHLWGANILNKYGINVDILPYEKFKFLKIINKLKVLGDVEQEIRVLSVAKKYDVIYSAHHLSTLLLGFLRKLKILKTPIVGIAYQSFSPNLWGTILTKLAVDGHDQIICLNQQLQEDLINNYNISKDKLSVVEWGADLPFYSLEKTTDKTLKKPVIISLGKTYRDYLTLLQSVKNLDCDLKIHCGGIKKISSKLTPSSNVFISEKTLDWQIILQEYSNAYAVAIPLQEYPTKPANAVGLTTVIEAMAMGKPIVMTRNSGSRYVIDIESEGIGLWVKTGDPQDWEKALKYLIENPEIADAMGKKGRKLAEERINLEVFSSKIADVLKYALKNKL